MQVHAAVNNTVSRTFDVARLGSLSKQNDSSNQGTGQLDGHAQSTLTDHLMTTQSDAEELTQLYETLKTIATQFVMSGQAQEAINPSTMDWLNIDVHGHPSSAYIVERPVILQQEESESSAPSGDALEDEKAASPLGNLPSQTVNLTVALDEVEETQMDLDVDSGRIHNAQLDEITGSDHRDNHLIADDPVARVEDGLSHDPAQTEEPRPAIEQVVDSEPDTKTAESQILSKDNKADSMPCEHSEASIAVSGDVQTSAIPAITTENVAQAQSQDFQSIPSIIGDQSPMFSQEIRPPPIVQSISKSNTLTTPANDQIPSEEPANKIQELFPYQLSDEPHTQCSVCKYASDTAENNATPYDNLRLFMRSHKGELHQHVKCLTGRHLARLRHEWKAIGKNVPIQEFIGDFDNLSRGDQKRLFLSIKERVNKFI